MPKLSFFIGALIGLGALSASVYAQELILEEVEGGYLIVNWEDTVVIDYLPPEEVEAVEEVEQVDEVPKNNGSDFLPHKGKKNNHKKNSKKNSKKNH